jgi:hypothetical protein
LANRDHQNSINYIIRRDGAGLDVIISAVGSATDSKIVYGQRICDRDGRSVIGGIVLDHDDIGGRDVVEHLAYATGCAQNGPQHGAGTGKDGEIQDNIIFAYIRVDLQVVFLRMTLALKAMYYHEVSRSFSHLALRNRRLAA